MEREGVYDKIEGARCNDQRRLSKVAFTPKASRAAAREREIGSIFLNRNDRKKRSSAHRVSVSDRIPNFTTCARGVPRRR